MCWFYTLFESSAWCAHRNCGVRAAAGVSHFFAEWCGAQHSLVRKSEDDHTRSVSCSSFLERSGVVFLCSATIHKSIWFRFCIFFIYKCFVMLQIFAPFLSSAVLSSLAYFPSAKELRTNQWNAQMTQTLTSRGRGPADCIWFVLLTNVSKCTVCPKEIGKYSLRWLSWHAGECENAWTSK